MAQVLLIGASRGIGYEMARQYVANGDQVIATARDDAGLARLEALGVAQALRVDVADPASVSGLSWQLDGVALDLAIYVAGVPGRGDALSPPTQQEFDQVMHANVLGAMQVIPQVAPLVEAGRGGQGGVFAFVSSILGSIAVADSSHSWLYRVSKTALNMAVASARFDYPRSTMVLLHPGWTQTDMGGAEAPVKVEDSARGMREVLESNPANGGFLQYDGQALDW